MEDPFDEVTATRLADVIDDLVAGRLPQSSWQAFFVGHYRGDVLEEARSQVVRIRVASDDHLSPDATAKLRAIAARLRNVVAAEAPTIPVAWQAFPCADYFASGYARTGWWDDISQCWYVFPADRCHVEPSCNLLVIGRPGVDGISWGYRLGLSGIWAHYPIDNELRLLASSVAALHEGYLSGLIAV